MRSQGPHTHICQMPQIQHKICLSTKIGSLHGFVVYSPKVSQLLVIQVFSQLGRQAFLAWKYMGTTSNTVSCDKRSLIDRIPNSFLKHNTAACLEAGWAFFGPTLDSVVPGMAWLMLVRLNWFWKSKSAWHVLKHAAKSVSGKGPYLDNCYFDVF